MQTLNIQSVAKLKNDLLNEKNTTEKSEVRMSYARNSAAWTVAMSALTCLPAARAITIYRPNISRRYRRYLYRDTARHALRRRWRRRWTTALLIQRALIRPAVWERRWSWWSITGCRTTCFDACVCKQTTDIAERRGEWDEWEDFPWDDGIYKEPSEQLSCGGWTGTDIIR